MSDVWFVLLQFNVIKEFCSPYTIQNWLQNDVRRINQVIFTLFNCAVLYCKCIVIADKVVCNGVINFFRDCACGLIFLGLMFIWFNDLVLCFTIGDGYLRYTFINHIFWYIILLCWFLLGFWILLVLWWRLNVLFCFCKMELFFEALKKDVGRWRPLLFHIFFYQCSFYVATN